MFSPSYWQTILFSLSSNNEDRPPPSELLFCASSIENVYEDVMLTTKYVPRLTHLQCALLHDLAAYVLSYDDSSTVAKCIIERRLDLIRGFCKKLKRKRYAKAYCRFRDIRSKRLAVDDEALELCIAEMFDKDLSRPFYFDQNEPKELVSIDIMLMCRILIVFSCISLVLCWRPDERRSSGNTCNMLWIQHFDKLTKREYIIMWTKIWTLRMQYPQRLVIWRRHLSCISGRSGGTCHRQCNLVFV